LVVGDDGLARPGWASVDPMLRDYYDTEWGLPVRDEQGLFERLSLEAFQSGLSWATILRKRPAFRAAFSDFSPDVVARFDHSDVEQLMADAGIVRNLAKVRATITNARATLRLREDADGDLAAYVWSFRPERTPQPATIGEVPTRSPESEALSKGLKRKGFVFVGPTTMFALMEAVGIVDTHLLGSHRRGEQWRLGEAHPNEKRPTESVAFGWVELRGFEPLTPSMPWRCATNCATAPYRVVPVGTALLYATQRRPAKSARHPPELKVAATLRRSRRARPRRSR
jgi:DNA-3-methyladenine glycosylase I